jgi:metal-responsive CopG/Arc/MetJ family transcriptional regulator
MLYIITMQSKKKKILMTFEDDLFRRIDDFRFDNRIHSRTQAIRRLIEYGLNNNNHSEKSKN